VGEERRAGAGAWSWANDKRGKCGTPRDVSCVVVAVIEDVRWSYKMVCASHVSGLIRCYVRVRELS
jgi:hypothetical protein